MDYRPGKCSQCGAEYKIPASFEHDVARCKKCSGVVNIGAVQSDGESAAAPQAPAEKAPKAMPVPAKKVARGPKPAPAKAAKPAPAKPDKPAKPAKPEEVSTRDANQKRKERGTLAKLKAARAAAEAEAASGSSGARAKPSPARPAAAAKSPAAAKANAPSKTGAARRGSRAGGSRRSSGRSGRASGRGDKEKKGAPMGLIAGGALVLIAAALFLFKDSLFGGGETTDAANQVSAMESNDPDATPAEPSSEASAGEEPAGDSEPEEAPPAEEPKKPEETKPKVKDAASIDLSALPTLKRARGTTDEEWAEMQELMAVWMDLDAGAAGPRSGRQLAEYGRKAMPVILNHWQTFDLENNPQHMRLGDMIQKQIKDICNGSNYGWRYEGDKDRVYFNKRVIESWNKAWLQVETSIVAWINIAKLDTKDPKAARELLALYGDAPEDDFGEVEDLDDLGVD